MAVVGASTVEGAHLREELARLGVPGGRVDLYGRSAGEVVLSEYAGEARMIQEPDLEEIARHELIFLCEPGGVADELASAAPAALIIDMQGCLPAQASPRGVPLEIASGVERGAGRFAVPHSLGIVLAEVLRPLQLRFGLAEAMAVVIRPAADFGREGVEELREQTVRLLNFTQVPVEVFGRQLAFNVIPNQLLSGELPEFEKRIAGDVTDLLGWSECRFTMKLLAAPVFHGHGLQIRFRLEGQATLDEVREAVEERGPSATAVGSAAATLLDVTGETGTRLADLSEDGLGAFWLWGAAGEVGSRGAQQAVRLAAALCDL